MENHMHMPFQSVSFSDINNTTMLEITTVSFIISHISSSQSDTVYTLSNNSLLGSPQPLVMSNLLPSMNLLIVNVLDQYFR